VGQVQRRDDRGGSALASLIREIGRAARGGWAQTIRLTVLIAVAAIALAVVTGR
jgi:hypothetical protein